MWLYESINSLEKATMEVVPSWETGAPYIIWVLYRAAGGAATNQCTASTSLSSQHTKVKLHQQTWNFPGYVT